MKTSRNPTQTKPTYINLNYKGRKAVINLSLKQLAEIVGSDKDIEEYQHILDKELFLEYPKQLKAKVLLEHDYQELLENAMLYLKVNAELEHCKTNTTKAISQLQNTEDKVRELKSTIKNKDNTITELKDKLHDMELQLTQLKTTNEHISDANSNLKSQIDKANKTVESIKYTSLMEAVNNEREYERLLYDLKDHKWYKDPFGTKKNKWIDNFLDKLHLNELKRGEVEKLAGDNTDD